MKTDRIVLSCALSLLRAVATLLGGKPTALAADRRPNIVMVFSDDVGPWNVSAYHRGMMGGRTPNIDRIAREGALFTDYYAQKSCTAFRAGCREVATTFWNETNSERTAGSLIDFLKRPQPYTE